MIDVTIENFEAEVIAASMTTPVLVDFWAPWCGPCKSLGPVLERLEEAYAGRFKLVKINSDDEQQLAGAFGIRSIPTCVLLMGGKPVDGFMGALPEGQIRTFLDKHVPSEDVLAADAETDEAEALMEAGDTGAALAKLADALARDPANEDARFDYVKLLIGAGGFEEAAAALQPMLSQIPVALRFEALRHWLDALLYVEAHVPDETAFHALQQRVVANKRDFEARLAVSRVMIAQGEWPAAMDELLEIIMRDKKWGDEVPRKTYVALLELMSPPPAKAGPEAAGKSAGGIELMGKSAHVEDPKLALVSSYRRKLSMALN